MTTKTPIPPAEIGHGCGPFGRRQIYCDELRIVQDESSLKVVAFNEEQRFGQGHILTIREEFNNIKPPWTGPQCPRGYSTLLTLDWNTDLSRLMADYLSSQLDNLNDKCRHLAELFIEDARNAHARRRVEDFLRKNPERIQEVAALLGLAE